MAGALLVAMFVLPTYLWRGLFFTHSSSRLKRVKALRLAETHHDYEKVFMAFDRQ